MLEKIKETVHLNLNLKGLVEHFVGLSSKIWIKFIFWAERLTCRTKRVSGRINVHFLRLGSYTAVGPQSAGMM